MATTLLGNADIGLFTFYASVHPTDTCGNNGLPVTPNSIKILGRFQKLKSITHPNLCQYIDIVRGKHERLVIITEYHKATLASLIQTGEYKDIFEIQTLAYNVMMGLDYLHFKNIVHRFLSPKNILLNKNNQVKLSKYGLYHMTHYNDDVMFPILDVVYTAPEVLLKGVGYNSTQGACLKSSDIWSLGMVLLDCFLEGKLWGAFRSKLPEVVNILLNMASYANKEMNSLEEIIKISGCSSKYKDIDTTFHYFLKQCLDINPTARPSIHELFQYDFIQSIYQQANVKNYSFYHQDRAIFPAIYRSESLKLPDFNKLLLEMNGDSAVFDDHLACRPIEEVFHLWRLAGGDIFTELKRHGLLNTKPPLLTFPTIILNNGEEFDTDKNELLKIKYSTVPISLDQLRHRLEHIDPMCYYPLVVEDDLYPIDLSETAKLPLVIREKDVEYQYHRIILFERLLLGYPSTRDRILKEARIDIPPYVRAKVWAVLLNVEGDIQKAYLETDKISMTTTDRQIEVDIPRCHQYNYLLSSPAGHETLKSVLKTWVVNHTNLVYWQGLDSLCAPFVTLNFNNQALASKCLSNFIPKYLYNFFLKDNSQVIHEYLAVFKQLIAFHEPALYNHLDEIGFQPELYAIPWFLTMFSHVFPLHKIYHLWDTLLLGNSMLPLCIGVAILQQFREQLLSFCFNDCILLFSDMPGIDIERCVKDSIKVFNHTPPSAALRKQDNPENRMKAPMEEQFMNLPEKEFLTLAQLRSEICVRISPRDLVRITQLIHQADQYPLLSRDQTNKHVGNNSKESKKKHKNDKNKITDPTYKILVIDLRSTDDFAVGHLPSSISIPFKQAVSETFELIQSPLTQIIDTHKGRMVMIVGNKGPEPVQFGQLLVSNGYRRVCVMDGSVSILKSLGYMSETL